MSAVVNQEKCAGCGVCIEVCPVDAISLNSERKAQINSEKCIECGICARECPNQAIELVQETTYPLVQRDLPQTIATAGGRERCTIAFLGESKFQPGGTLRSVSQELLALWTIVSPTVNTVRPPQPRSNKSLGQEGRQGRGRGRRHRGGRR
jgi:NAD-dependent dihydropyrimidine dehydrogenase PreA subunit